MTLPRIQPIAPTWRKTPFDDPDWLFDLKYDGFRGLCYLDRGRNRLISRNNNVMTRFEALADQIASLLDVHDAILDGEVIAADETGRPMFATCCGARGRLPMSRSISSGSTARIYGPYRCTSAGGSCKRCCRRPRRSYQRRYPLPAGDASCSI